MILRVPLIFAQVFRQTTCLTNPYWFANAEYRIKPESKPDVVGNVYVNSLGTLEWIMGQMKPNLKLIFDGETGELKSAEVLK